MTVDLTLPRRSSPTIDPYKDLADDLLPFALYIHAGLLGPDELTDIERVCNSQVEGSHVVQRAPRYDFNGQPLRAAFDEQLHNVISQRRHDPFYFVAVIDKDWREKGVLLVTMDDGSDDEVAYVDQMRVPAKEAGLLLVNLQIANVDWAEYKEEYEEAGGDDDNGADNGDDAEDQEEDDPSKEGDQPYNSPQTDEEYSDGASVKLPNVGYWIGLYAIPEMPFEAIMQGVQPSWGPPVPLSEMMCRPQGRVSIAAELEQMVAESARLHPMRCRNNPHLHRTMYLVADTVTPGHDGLLLVQLKWDDKDIGGKSVAELAKLGEAAETDTQRLPFEEGTTLTIFNEIKAGYRPWKHDHKTFMAYAGPMTRYPSAYLKAVDGNFSRRKSGSERFIEAAVQYDDPSTDEALLEEEKVLQKVVDDHWGFIHEERFRETLCPGYFVFNDKELATKDKKELVTLVKTEEHGQWTTMQCAAGSAYQTLCDIVGGELSWQASNVS